LIPTATDQLAIGHDDRAERAAAMIAHSGAGEGDRFVHPMRVRRGFVNVIGHLILS
jgi:hypothetical protein